MKPPIRRRRPPGGGESLRRVLFSHEGTDYLWVQHLPDSERPEASVRYLARPRTREGLGERVEVVVVPRDVSMSALGRLKEEVRLGARLSHPGIARVHGLYEQRENSFLVLEHVKGCNLETVMSLGALCGRGMSERFAVYVCSRVAAALHYAHTRTDEQGQPLGIVHRGVCAESIRMGWGEGVVKLADFSAAFSLLPGRHASERGLVRGMIETAAPERLPLKGTAEVDARSDLFSLGVVLLELLTGQFLYDQEGLEAAVRRAPPALLTQAPLTAERPGWVSVKELAARAAAFHGAQVERAMGDAEVSEPVAQVLRGLLRHAPHARSATAQQVHAALEECLRAAGEGVYGARQAADELNEARTEARRSPLRSELLVLEPDVFEEETPGGGGERPPPVLM